MTYNFLTAGLQNVILLLAVVEELSSPTFMCCFFLAKDIASCIGPNFVIFCITLLSFSSVYHY